MNTEATQAFSAEEPTNTGNLNDKMFHLLVHRLQKNLYSNTPNYNRPLFTTDADNLVKTYLDEMPDELYQYSNCSCCKAFIRKYGGLAVIDEVTGRIKSPLLDDRSIPSGYRSSVSALARLVRRSKVTGVFLSNTAELGARQTGKWSHLCLHLGQVSISWRKGCAGRDMATMKHNYDNVTAALQKYPLDAITTAMQVVRSGELYRAEKVSGQAQWLSKLATARALVEGGLKDNLTWLAVATAPDGFCHLGSSMLGTLLDDILKGHDFETVVKKFAVKMGPLVYQRPQAAPSNGTIEQANKLFESLGLVKSLERRYATLGDIKTFWLPTVGTPARGTVNKSGPFDHLRVSQETPTTSLLNIPPTRISWEKFERTVLPTATHMELFTPHAGAYTSLVTAAHDDAPPILQWDCLEDRYPVSWYFRNARNFAKTYSLSPHAWVKVNALTHAPWAHRSEIEHFGKAVMFILNGAAETEDVASDLFPETLRSELHGVRAVIEAHAKKSRILGKDNQSAAGFVYSTRALYEPILRVWVGEDRTEYTLKSWD